MPSDPPIDRSSYVRNPSIRLAYTILADDNGDEVSHQHKLKELSDRLEQSYAFAKGQFVKWKPGLKNRRFPEYGEPCIVIAVLPNPIFDPSENSASSAYFHEPLSIIIGTCREGDFLEFRVDGRRFQAVQ